MATVGTSGFERALVGTVPDVRRGQLAVDARAIGVIEVEKSGPAKKIIGGGVKQDAAKSQGCMLGLAYHLRTAIPRPRESTRRGSLPCVFQTEGKFRGGRPRPHLTCKDPAQGANRGKAPRGPVSSRQQRPYLAPHGGRKGICAEFADRADATRGQSIFVDFRQSAQSARPRAKT